jgi:hypothetical protein
VGSFNPRALMLHHDASNVGPSPDMAKFIAQTGRPRIPAPLAQCWVDTKGTWHVLASGRSNHAGIGGGFGRIPRDSGNTYAIGVETDHTTGERFPAAQLDAIIRGFAALAVAMRIDPANSVCGHKEYAPGRKPDPHPLDMREFRGKVSQQMAAIRATNGRPPAVKRPPTTVVVDLSNVRAAARVDPKAAQGHVTHKADVLVVERALKAEGLLETDRVDGSFGTMTVAAYAKFQRKLGFKGTDADGIPGLTSLTKLGQQHNFRVKN